MPGDVLVGGSETPYRDSRPGPDTTSAPLKGEPRTRCLWGKVDGHGYGPTAVSLKDVAVSPGITVGYDGITEYHCQQQMGEIHPES